MKHLNNKSFAVIAAFGASACAHAQIDPFPFSGTVTGYFSNGTDSINGLTYQGSTFDVLPTFYAPSGFLNAQSFQTILDGGPSTPNIDNLGSFYASKPISQYVGDTFTLDVTYTSPFHYLSSNVQTVTYEVMSDGQIKNTSGINDVQFTTPSGSFYVDTYMAYGLQLVQGKSVAPIGDFYGGGVPPSASTPEPKSWAGCAMGALGFAFLRRKKAKPQS